MPLPRPAPPARRRGGAFLLPLIAVLWASNVGSERPAIGRDLVVAAVVCVAAGAAWNLLHRRDLTDRLTHLASCFSVVVVLHLGLSWDSTITSSEGSGWGVVGVVTGLVWAEHWWRRRDARSRAYVEQPALVPRQAPQD